MTAIITLAAIHTTAATLITTNMLMNKTCVFFSQEFHEHLHVFDGSRTQEEYFRRHNPIWVLDKIRVPTIYLNAYDVSIHGEPCNATSL